MKKALSTVALSVLLFSCKQENKNLKTEEIKKAETENIVYKKIIENEKLEEFTVNLFQGKDESNGKLELKKGKNAKLFIYNFKDIPYLDISKVKSVNQIISFEDFNFDGEKEIVIFGDNGLYIYARKTGKPKNLFEEDNNRNCPKGTKNFIFTYRGEYEKNEKEKTIKISGSNSAFSGTEIIYRANENGKMNVVKKCVWDYGN